MTTNTGGHVVLIVDDDPDIRVFLEVTLELHGFEVVAAEDGEEAVERAVERQPDVILMDVMMPRLDGIGAMERLRSDGRVSHIPVILLTAKAQGIDKVQGLEAGADDYITKPFDPDELIARVHATLRRAAQVRTVSPLTGLPGNARIEQELARRIEGGDGFAVLYADLDRFKAYNDHYGWQRGDEAIKACADVLRAVVARHGGPETFIGHIGGDDFVILAAVDRFETLAGEICRQFDEEVPDLYDPEDRDRGYIEVRDRQGNLSRFEPIAVSVGVAHTRNRTFEHPKQAADLASEMKAFAKRSTSARSTWAVDRRTEGEADAAETPAVAEDAAK